jgi:hypothetical protein
VTFEEIEKIAEFEGELKTKHQPFCPWLNNPCSSSFTSVQTLDAEECQLQTTLRVKSIATAYKEKQLELPRLSEFVSEELVPLFVVDFC